MMAFSLMQKQFEGKSLSKVFLELFNTQHFSPLSTF